MVGSPPGQLLDPSAAPPVTPQSRLIISLSAALRDALLAADRDTSLALLAALARLVPAAPVTS